MIIYSDLLSANGPGLNLQPNVDLKSLPKLGQILLMNQYYH